MRILYINHYAGSPHHGMEFRPHYLARHWMRLGHEVLIVAASVSHLRTHAPVVEGESSEEAIEGVPYLWLKTPGYTGNGMRRAINMAAFVQALYRMRGTLAQRFRADVVIASSTYTWDIFPAWAIARRCGAKLIYEVHDLWPLSPMELGAMPRWHPFIVSLQMAEDFACRRADAVVSILPFADRHLSKRGMSTERYHHVPNGIELAEWDHAVSSLPQSHADLIATLRQRNAFLVGYAGSHGTANALESLLDAATHLAGQKVEFVLAGQGPNKPALQQAAVRAGLHNVHFLNPVPKSAVPQLLRCMDALFIGWKKHPLYRFGIGPNKLMDYMAAGRPVISAVNAPNDAVAESRCGITVPAEDGRAIADAVLRLMAMPAAMHQSMGAAGITYVRTRHDYAVLARQFADIMARLKQSPAACCQQLEGAAK